MSTPIISVALATYNGEKYLIEQIDSILNQTYKNIEIIISEDNSTDSTIEIVKKYINNNSNIKLVFNEGEKGFINNFENAIKHCKGEFIAFADQDDVWFENKIEILYQNIIISNSLLIYSDSLIVDSKLQSKNNTKLSTFYPEMKYAYDFKNLIHHNFIPGSHSLISKDLLPLILPFPGKQLGHDWWIAIIAASYNKIKYIDIPLMYYRRHQNTTTQIKDDFSFDRFNLLNFKKYYLGNKTDKELNYNRIKEMLESQRFEKKLVSELHQALLFYQIKNSIFVIIKNKIYLFKNLKYISPTNNKIKFIFSVVKRFFIG